MPTTPDPRRHRRRVRAYGALATAATLTAMAASLATGPPAQAALGRPGAAAPGTTSSDSQLNGVSAVSATDAWAAGYYENSSGVNVPLIEHWNGTAWKTKASPVPSGAAFSFLQGVSADSATDAWAVGYYDNSSSVVVPLIQHWNGTAWSQVASPAPSGATYTKLMGVTAVSATDAWAVGSSQSSSGTQPLIEQWNGTAWSQVTAPAPSGATYSYLDAVSVDSATDAWAAGYYQSSSGEEPLLEHWNGTTWEVVTSPAPPGATATFLNGVSAVSATDAWAVGYGLTDSGTEPVILHWNGTAWKVAKRPVATGPLEGVSAVSATDVWAAGYHENSSGVQVPVILRWNGTAWKQAKSPTPSGAAGTALEGVSADSAADAWAAGQYGNGSGVTETVILRWNGTAWKVVKSPNGT